MTSLSAGLNLAMAGIRATEAKIATTSGNVTNADVEGYTRKIHQSDTFTTNSGTYPTGGAIVSAILNPYLQEQLIEDVGLSIEKETLYDFMSQLSDRLGRTDGSNTLNEALDDFASALEELYITPEDSGLKFQVMTTAERLVKDLNDMSRIIQDLRNQADSEIGSSVERINDSVLRIHDLNKAIALAGSQGVSIADLEDQRRTEMASLSEEIDVQYYMNNQNQVQIYSAGQPLLTGVPRTINYTSLNFVDSSITYPGGFDNITIGGTDITNEIATGKLAGLVEMRDTVLVQEQQKLDEFAAVLAREVNTISNQGAAYPGPNILTGTVDTTTLAFGAPSGLLRIATTDQNGVVTSFADINVAAFTTPAATVAAINGTAGLNVTASLNANNQLVLTAAGTDGIVLNDYDIGVPTPTDMDGSGTGFSQFFGMNNIFQTDSFGAESIGVNPNFITNSSALPTGKLNNSAALAVGDAGVDPGDGSIVDAMNDIISASSNFSAAGNFNAQSASIDVYADLIISDIANRASSYKADSEVTSLAVRNTRETLYNLQGVNIDEEMTYLLDLESKYQASALVLSRIQDMLDELMNALR